MKAIILALLIVAAPAYAEKPFDPKSCEFQVRVYTAGYASAANGTPPAREFASAEEAMEQKGWAEDTRRVVRAAMRGGIEDYLSMIPFRAGTEFFDRRCRQNEGRQ